METVPNRRRFLQGEMIDPMRFTNDPYFDFMYSTEWDSNTNAYRAYKGFIIPSNYPNKTLYNVTVIGGERPENYGHTSIGPGCGYYCETFRVILPAGAYKIGIFKAMTNSYENYTYVTSISNSTFKIIQNNFTVSLNRNTYKKGDTIIASISSTKFLQSPFSHSRAPIYFSISNRDYGGNYYQWDRFYPVESTNQTLSNSIVIDWDDIGTFSFEAMSATGTTIVKEFTITQ